MSEHKKSNVGPNSINEKPKDLKKALKKMIKYLNPFMMLIIVALVLSCLSSVFSIIGPNKLSNLTDEISSGLVINKEHFEQINEKITKNLDEEKLKSMINDIIGISNSITDSSVQMTLSSKEQQDYLSNLSDEKLRLMLKETTYNEVIVSVEDKIYLIRNANNMNQTNIDELPESIKNIIFPKFRLDDVEISTDDQIKYIKLMSTVNMEDKNNIYSILDNIPKNLKDYIKPQMNLDKIKSIGLFLLILYLVSALFNFIQSYIMATASNNFAKSLRTKISEKTNILPLKYFDTHSKGDILSRITNDVDTIGVSMYQSLGSLVGAITLFLGSIIMMFKTNEIMAITAITSSLIGFVFMGLILKKSQKYFTARQVELGKLNGHIEEIYSNHNVVKAYNGGFDASKKFEELNNSVYECNRKSQFLSGLMPPIMVFIGNFSYVAVCIVGALLVMNGNITFGVIVAFMIYVRLFTSPLSQIAQGMTNLQTTAAASERVFEYIEEEEMTKEENKKYLDPKNVIGNISFEHVRFGYNKSKTIINDFSCDVKAGSKIAIVGPTGAGKTTMVNLLMKFYEINSGDIKIDGVSINDLTRQNIHDLFIMVLQDTWVFNGTIKENVKFNHENVTDKQVIEALNKVGIKHFVKSLPGTIDYKLSDTESISSGQKQLLTIARGMIENAPFLILDEATSSVDTRTEQLVSKAMDKLTKGRTSFIIAHRLSTIKNADLILVMKDGNIVEQGTHEELLEKKSFYAELYNSQFQN